ncbi:Glutathione S-transferase-like protein ustS [Hypsizygus marmoreus]|uniref:Glutathione S-transferase-like protein ustS n=1 Tax=Hypsizygus marmoreus TaxID=39966 RepID=A0A369J8P9_HYPMA|nr:Glutathione S-transferase-like protein ustS [Hypsizygus marmoreus]
MSTESENIITLYDIPTAKGAETWSPNVWRVRMTLNYKRLPYKTQWVEYPDIGKVGQEIGAKPTTPNPDGSGTLLWTCPMLVDPTHLDASGKPTVLSDSLVIVKYLDAVYPERKVIEDGTDALHAAWAAFIWQNLTGKIVNLVVPLCPNILSERSREYFVATREKWWGPLADMCPDRVKVWAEVQNGLDKIATALNANDFTLVAPLFWVSSIVGKDELDALESWNGGRWRKIMDLHQASGVLKIQ